MENAELIAALRGDLTEIERILIMALEAEDIAATADALEYARKALHLLDNA